MKKIILILLIPFFNLLSQPLTGTKTIGATGDYITFQEAVTALTTNGVGTGGVVFNVQPGIYPERISIPSITGTSAVNQVLFQGAGGATIKGTGTSATSDVMVTVTACDYITFDGINVEDGGTSTADQVEYGWLITGTGTKGSTFITIQNSSVTLGGGTTFPPTASRGIVIRSAATAVEGANNNNLINNVTINKTTWGISLAGKANLQGQPTFPDFNNEIRNCKLGTTSRIGHFSASSSIGISIASQKAVKVTGNTIDSVITTTATAPILPVSISGISVDNASGEISYNKIHNIKYYGPGGSSPNGIRISIIDNDTMKIFNNFISDIFKSDFTPPADNSTYLKGIWLFKQTGGGGTALTYYNTIFLEGESPVSYASVGFYLAAASTGTSFAVLKNNIIINNIIPTNAVANPYGNSAYAVIDGNITRTQLISNNNLLYVGDTAAHIGQLGRLLGSPVVNAKTFLEWQTLGQTDSQSSSKPVVFVNSASGDLHLAGTSIGDISLKALPVSWITNDIDRENRHPATTYMGADENTLTVPVELSSFTALQNGKDVILTWKTATEINNLGFEIEKSINNKVFTKIGFVKGHGNRNISYEYDFIDNNPLLNGTYLYRLKQIDTDGKYKYSFEVEVNIAAPTEFSMDQNYPNPFNPTTIIKYSLDKTEMVSLKVYDILGNLITTLVNEVREPGFYENEFSSLSNKLSSGVYIYQLRSGERTITHKMILMK